MKVGDDPPAYCGQPNFYQICHWHFFFPFFSCADGRPLCSWGDPPSIHPQMCVPWAVQLLSSLWCGGARKTQCWTWLVSIIFWGIVGVEFRERLSSLSTLLALQVSLCSVCLCWGALWPAVFAEIPTSFPEVWHEWRAPPEHWGWWRQSECRMLRKMLYVLIDRDKGTDDCWLVGFSSLTLLSLLLH